MWRPAGRSCDGPSASDPRCWTKRSSGSSRWPVERRAAVKVAAVQHDIAWEDPDANFAHLAPLIANAAASGARLVLLSEMFSTGFSMAPERVAEAPGGPSERFLVEQAGVHGVW